MMTIGQLIKALTDRLEEGRETGVTEDSQVVLEGHDEDDNLVQAYGTKRAKSSLTGCSGKEV